MANEINGYVLSRAYFNFCYENPEKVKPHHAGLFFYCIELCNSLGWRDKFGLPTRSTMEILGFSNYNSYAKVLQDLVDFGFIKMVEKAKNQHTACIIALCKNDEALHEALHTTLSEQCSSTAVINKPIKTIINNTNKETSGDKSPTRPVKKSIEEREKEFGLLLVPYIDKYGKEMIRKFFNYWTEKNPKGTKMQFEIKRTFEISKRLVTWKDRDQKINKTSTQKLNENGEPLDQVEKFKLRAQQLADANR